MKRYEVVITYNWCNRQNKLIVWADSEEQAIKRAMKSWGNPTMYKSVTATDTKYFS